MINHIPALKNESSDGGNNSLNKKQVRSIHSLSYRKGVFLGLSVRIG